MDDLCFLTARDLARGYARGDFSPVEVARACIARAHAFQGRLNAFCLIDEDTALAAARASEARWAANAPYGSLDGVPATVKDLTHVAGWPTRFGSLACEDAPPERQDAPPVTRLRNAGIVLIGKTTTPEFGHKGVTDSPLSGITRNPHDPDKTPGGSSGGAAVAASTGAGVLHVGSDGGGSIRIPAAFTGVVGMKPTWGRVPVWPQSVFWMLSHIGPIARTVNDCAAMLDVMAGPSKRDPNSLPGTMQLMKDARNADVKGLRIGFDPAPAGRRVASGIARQVQAGVDALESAGAEIETVSLPFAGSDDLIEVIWKGLARAMISGIDSRHMDRFDPLLLRIAQQAGSMAADGIGLALKQAQDLATKMEAMFDRFDLLVTPTMPVAAFGAGRNIPEGWPDDTRGADWNPFTFPLNLSRQPAISVPCGLIPAGMTDTGLPAGLQIIGPRMGEQQILRAARAVERQFPAPRPAITRRPPPEAPHQAQ